MKLVLLVVVLLFAPSQCSFKWKDLTQKELEEWYTPTDLCMLQSEDKAGYPQHIRANNCSEFSQGSSRLFCAVGMGSNKQPCFSPFVSRPSFKRGLVGYTDAARKPIMEALRNIANANVTLILLGDSTTRQKIVALECEILREHPKNEFKGITFGILPCHTEFEIRLHDSPHVIKMHGISIGPNSVDCLKGGLGRADVDGGGVYENARHIIKEINDNNQGVFILANLGLWYNDESKFEPVVVPLLDWLGRVASNTKVQNIVAWHETMHQHWPNSIGSGYFNKMVVDAQEDDWNSGRVDLKSLPLSEWQVPNCCVPISNTSWMADWRNDIVKQYIYATPERKKISLLPFADITR